MAWALALTSGAKVVYKTVSDAYAASTFNRDAYDEAHRESVNYRNYDVDCNADFDSEEEWTAVIKVQRNPYKEPDEEYLVQQSASKKLQQLRFKITQGATKAASEAVGVSLDYTQCALKFAALEMARDVGWISNCKTATEAVRAVQARLPVLEDVKMAYQTGSSAGRRERSASDTRYLSGSLNAAGRCGSKSYEPVSEILHPRHVQVPSSLDDISTTSDNRIRANLAMHRSPPIWDPETRAELELVFEPVIRSAKIPRNDPEVIESATAEQGEEGKFDDVDLHSEDGAEYSMYESPEGDLGDEEGPMESKFVGLKLYSSGPIIGSRDSEELKVEEANRR